MKKCNGHTGVAQMFVALPVDTCHQLSPQLSSLLQTRMANHDEDISVVASSCTSLKPLCNGDYYSIIQEKSKSMLPINWSVIHYIYIIVTVTRSYDIAVLMTG